MNNHLSSIGESAAQEVVAADRAVIREPPPQLDKHTLKGMYRQLHAIYSGTSFYVALHNDIPFGNQIEAAAAAQKPIIYAANKAVINKPPLELESLAHKGMFKTKINGSLCVENFYNYVYIIVHMMILQNITLFLSSKIN